MFPRLLELDGCYLQSMGRNAVRTSMCREAINAMTLGMSDYWQKVRQECGRWQWKGYVGSPVSIKCQKANADQERRKILEQLKSVSNMEFTDESPVSVGFADPQTLPSTQGPGTLLNSPLQMVSVDDDNHVRPRKKEGFLLVTTSNTKSTISHFQAQGWRKVWCVVSDDNLHEYSDWKKKMENYHILPLKLTTVREAKTSDRRFCFEIISPTFGRRIYQAIGDEDMRAWVNVIQSAIENQLIGQLSKDESQDDISSVISVQHIFRNADIGIRFVLIAVIRILNGLVSI